eukprot:1161835-Pelagomonas_calceolata.AAC.7
MHDLLADERPWAMALWPCAPLNSMALSATSMFVLPLSLSQYYTEEREDRASKHPFIKWFRTHCAGRPSKTSGWSSFPSLPACLPPALSRQKSILNMKKVSSGHGYVERCREGGGALCWGSELPRRAGGAENSGSGKRTVKKSSGEHTHTHTHTGHLPIPKCQQEGPGGCDMPRPLRLARCCAGTQRCWQGAHLACVAKTLFRKAVFPEIAHAYCHTEHTQTCARARAFFLPDHTCAYIHACLPSPQSTLIKILTSELKPENGGVTRHPNLRVAYVAQHAFHHLEECLDISPARYILRRYSGGEDKGAQIVDGGGGAVAPLWCPGVKLAILGPKFPHCKQWVQSFCSAGRPWGRACVLLGEYRQCVSCPLCEPFSGTGSASHASFVQGGLLGRPCVFCCCIGANALLPLNRPAQRIHVLVCMCVGASISCTGSKHHAHALSFQGGGKQGASPDEWGGVGQDQEAGACMRVCVFHGPGFSSGWPFCESQY